MNNPNSHRNGEIAHDVAYRYTRIFGGRIDYRQTAVDDQEALLVDKHGLPMGMVGIDKVFKTFPEKEWDDSDEIPF